MSAPAPGRAGFVAIVGRPNSGKSTLLNRVVGTELSIATPKAQTTRENVRGIWSEPRGQIVFLDTPGLHRAKPGGINERLIAEATRALEDPDLVWYLVDPASALHHEEAVLEKLMRARSPIFILLNKCDQPAIPPAGKPLEDLLLAALEQGRGPDAPPTKLFRISALDGTGVPELVNATWDAMPEGHAYYPDPEQLSDKPLRFFAAEKIREQLFLLLDEEVPYSCAVRIESFEEMKRPLRIEARIVVERDSQKAMVIGKAGAMIKEIGSAARVGIEALVGEKVHLALKVETWKNWTRDAHALESFGFELPRSLPKHGKSGKKRSSR